ncbi:MAG TPA: HAD family hydrolase [Aggregatilineales bacterium]|nr:HAD family hydrolase [Aggregatilineales bacterium]
MRYFFDLDDTLVVGPTTWAINQVFPDMIRQHHVPYDPTAFAEALLQGQQRARGRENDAELLDDLFRRMNWPPDLKSGLIAQIFEHYQPQLFDDTLPMLKRLQARADEAYILSNNDHAPELAEALGIRPYVRALFTPRSCGVAQGKPQPALWSYITAHHPGEGGPDTLVGDDPWTDGLFADTCQISCLILDRLDRFAAVPMPHRRLRSLDEL